jgi:hypothetical protein
MGDETLFVWDWEMVHEAIDPYSTSAVFSGVLWYGLGVLETLGTQNKRPRVVYAEGTRRELLWHLTAVARRYQRHVRHANRAQQLGRSFEGVKRFSARADWKDVLGKLLELVKLDESIDRLLLLLTKYAEPMPVELEAVPQQVFNAYRESLSRERGEKEAQRRNEADAWNLASVDYLSRTLGIRSVGLITATTAVHRVGQEQSRDPFYFALDLQMRRRYPDRENRKTVLQEMLSKLYSVLAKIGTVEALESRSGTSHIGRGEIADLLENLPRLGEDAVLKEIADIAIRGAQAIQNSRVQSRQSESSLVDDYGEYLSLPRLSFKIQRVLSLLGMDRPSAEGMQLQWETRSNRAGVQRLELVARGRAAFIEAEVGEAVLVLRWKTEVSLQEFLLAVDHAWGDLFSPSDVRVLAMPFSVGRGSGQFLISTADRPAHVARFLAAVGPNRIAMLRLITGEFSFWYDTSSQLSRQGLFVHTGDTWAVVSLPPGLKGHDAVRRFFEATSSDWLFDTVVESALTALPTHQSREGS